LLANADNAQPLVDALVEAENEIVGRLVLQIAALIVLFFVCLLVYRLIVRRFLN
jgi:hypothetical protein